MCPSRIQQFNYYKILSHAEVTELQWYTFVQDFDTATAFHSPVMFRIYTQVPFYEPFAFFVVDSAGCCLALLTGYMQTVKPGLFSGLTKRAVLMQSPLYSDIHALESLLSYYTCYYRNRVVYTEIRNHVDTLPQRSYFSANGFLYEDHLDIFIRLDQSQEDVLKTMDPTRKKQIKRGYNRGVTVSVIKNEDIEQLEKCIEIVIDLYKRIHLPLPSRDFILSAARFSDDTCKFVCFAAKYSDEVIGTRMVLCSGELIYDWYAGSLVHHYDKYPNDILPWEVFKWGTQNGYKIFDFGGAGKPGVPYGVRDYKLKFGGTLVNYGRYLKIHSPLKYFIAKMGFQAIKNITRLRLKFKNCFYL